MRKDLTTSLSTFTALLLLAGCGAGAEKSSDANHSAGSGASTSVGGSSSNVGGSSSSSSGGSAVSNGGTVGGPMTDPVDPTLPPGTCGLDQPAFCEDFEATHAGGRGGDIDETRWSFARWAHAVQYMWLRMPASTSDEHLFPATFCNEPFNGILPDEDVKICTGAGIDGNQTMQLNEVFDDEGDFALHSMRIRQPFDFTDRTGKIVWDVDAKVNPLNLGHGWWIEIWITEQPIPIPYHEAPTIAGYPPNAIGMAFQFGADCPEDSSGSPDGYSTEAGWQSGLETVHITNSSRILHAYPFWEFPGDMTNRCFRTADQHPNHFELNISKDKLEVYVSDYDDTGNMKLRGTVEPLELEFQKGYVHFQHGQYNAPKDGHVAPAQTFRWDNIGFDGPTYPNPRGYSVENNSETIDVGRMIGWMMDDGHTESFNVPGVDPSGAISATLSFNGDYEPGMEIEYTVNGGSPHTMTVPVIEEVGRGLRGVAADVPVNELVAGDNTITVRIPTPTYNESIGNIDLDIEVPQ